MSQGIIRVNTLNLAQSVLHYPLISNACSLLLPTRYIKLIKSSDFLKCWALKLYCVTPET